MEFDIKKRRAINFWWALVSVLLVFAVAIGSFFIFGGETWVLLFMICLALSFAIFWGFYLVYTSFKKNRYPFVTYMPRYDASKNAFTNITNNKFIWIVLLPVLSAVIIPLIILLINALQMPEDFNWKAIVSYVVCMVIAIVNNISYIITINKLNVESVEENDFIIKTK